MAKENENGNKPPLSPKPISRRMPTEEQPDVSSRQAPSAVVPVKPAPIAGRLPTQEELSGATPRAQEPPAGAAAAPVLQKYAPLPRTVPVKPLTAINKPPPLSKTEVHDPTGDILVDIDQESEPYVPSSLDWVGEYQLIKKLGQGGMGSVWLARSSRTAGRYAIKFLTLITGADALERFELEAKAMGACQCDEVVNIFWHGVHNGVPFIVTEFVDGRSLYQEINRIGALPLSLVADYIISVCKALIVIHDNFFIHRDIKATNIMISKTGKILLIDFGVIKRIGVAERSKLKKVDVDDLESSQASGLMGTLRYMSREQVRGLSLTPKADSYSLGVVMYEALTGRQFFEGLEESQIMVTIASDDDYPPIKLPNLPDDVVALLNACLSKNPAKRPTPAEIIRVYEKYQHKAARTVDPSKNPYPGMCAFSENESEGYLGCEEHVRAVSDLTRLNPIVVVAGEPGVGKSSLLRAGVGSSLAGQNWHVRHCKVGPDPLQALAEIIAALVSYQGMSATAIKEQITATPAYAGVLVREAAERFRKNVLITFDAFEELITLVKENVVREKLAECILSIADDPTSKARVLIGMRADFIDGLTQVRGLATAVIGSLYLLPRPSAAAIFTAMVRPAEAAGFQVNHQIAEKMAEELHDSDSAYLLMQFIFTQIWPKRDLHTRVLLDERIYAEIGGIDGVLGRYAESLFANLPPAFEPAIRRVLRAFVTPEGTRAIVSLDQLFECAGKEYRAIEEIINKLIKGRLILEQENRTWALIHDALITKWDRLRQILSTLTLDDAFRQKLQKDADAWVRSGKNTALLWTGSQSLEAKLYKDKFELDGWNSLPALFKEFIEATVEQLAIRERKKRRRLVAGIGALSAVALGALLAVYLIGKAELAAKRESEIARAAESVAKRAEEAAEKAKKEALANAERANRNAQERDRAAKLAEESARKAAAESERANNATSELLEKNEALLEAMTRVKRNAKEARLAREQAVNAANELRKMLESERERIRFLESSTGEIYESIKQ